MASYDTERFCPHHGEYVLLADCPIVATSELVNGQARQASGAGFGNLGTDVPYVEDATTAGERKRVTATFAPDLGSLLHSKIDDVTRKVLARPAGRRKPSRRDGDLPSAAALARYDQEALPARACPLCCHPLPEAIDERDPYVIGVAGHTASSKTTTIVALMRALDAHGPSALGVRGFSATSATIDYLRALGEDAVSAVATVQGTEPGRRHPPFEFLTSLPATQRQGEREAIVLLQDAAGEDLTNHDTRVYFAPSIAWADAILFVYNPEDAPWWPSRLPDRPRQSALLDGIREDLARRASADPGFRFPPLVIAVSKADLLTPRPDFSKPIPEAAVQEYVTKLGDASMVAAADRWERVYWECVAPQPEDGSGQKGVTELFKLLLSVLRD